MRLKIAVPMMLLLLLCACKAAEESAQTAVSLRTGLVSSGECSFFADLKADYGTHVREFNLACHSVISGDTRLTVLGPQTAEGVTATVSGEGADVSFGDTVLAVEEFETRRISPVAAPYLLSKAWSEGYISQCGRDGELETAEYTLGYGAEQLSITTWFQGGVPLRAEISDGKSVLITCEISEFSMEKTKEDDENGKQPAENAETDLGGGGPEPSPA